MDLAAARNKLRQAELLCSHLRALPKELAADLRRAGGSRDHRLELETFFSACIGAARSSFFIAWKKGGQQFKDVFSHWKCHTLDQESRARFNTMLHLRDRDVHFGELPAEVLPKMMEAEDNGSVYHAYNAAFFGARPMTEHTNPDGATVRATSLQGTVGLYIDVNGSRVEAITACVAFISQLRSLLQTADAAQRP
jgi:hypothetical protein